jgi:hypothetical protein
VSAFLGDFFLQFAYVLEFDLAHQHSEVVVD